MDLGVVADSTGWKSYYSPCGCTYSLQDPPVVLGMCHEHAYVATAADTAAGILARIERRATGW